MYLQKSFHFKRIFLFFSLKGEQHLRDLSNLKCLVFDEADRMVEEGHFEEMKSILALVHTQTQYVLHQALILVISVVWYLLLLTLSHSNHLFRYTL